MSSNLTTRRRAAPIPLQVWNTYRDRIKALYLVDRRRLIDVCDELKKEPPLQHATVKQFQRQIHSWGFDKNVKKEETERILSNPSSAQTIGRKRITNIQRRKYEKRKAMKNSDSGSASAPAIDSTSNCHSLATPARLPREVILDSSPIASSNEAEHDKSVNLQDVLPSAQFVSEDDLDAFPHWGSSAEPDELLLYDDEALISAYSQTDSQYSQLAECLRWCDTPRNLDGVEAVMTILLMCNDLPRLMNQSSTVKNENLSLVKLRDTLREVNFMRPMLGLASLLVTKFWSASNADLVLAGSPYPRHDTREFRIFVIREALCFCSSDYPELLRAAQNSCDMIVQHLFGISSTFSRTFTQGQLFPLFDSFIQSLDKTKCAAWVRSLLHTIALIFVDRGFAYDVPKIGLGFVMGYVEGTRTVSENQPRESQPYRHAWLPGSEM